MYYVNVYKLDRLYGGPEEGGWWYTYGDCIEYHTADTQHQAAVILNQLRMKAENTDHRIKIEEKEGTYFPKERPRYE